MRHFKDYTELRKNRIDLLIFSVRLHWRLRLVPQLILIDRLLFCVSFDFPQFQSLTAKQWATHPFGSLSEESYRCLLFWAWRECDCAGAKLIYLPSSSQNCCPWISCWIHLSFRSRSLAHLSLENDAFAQRQKHSCPHFPNSLDSSIWGKFNSDQDGRETRLMLNALEWIVYWTAELNSSLALQCHSWL